MSLMKSFFGLENQLQTSLEWLPEEIILKILSYLKIQELLRFSHFSKNIIRICHDKSLWKIVDLSEQKVKAKVIKAVLQNDCENLNLYRTQIDGSVKLSKTSKLKYLNLYQSYVSKSFLNEMLLSCCSLQKLMLGENWFNTAQLQQFCSQNSQTLQVLRLGSLFCRWSTTPVQLIVTHLTKLQEINLQGCILDHDALNQLVSGLSPEIEKVILACILDVTDEHIEKLVTRCTKISALSIRGLWSHSPLTNKTITSILKNLKSLTELDIRKCPNIELKKVLELESLPKLQVLNYGLFPFDEMPGLMKKNPHLIINKKVNYNVINVGGRIAKI